MRIAVIYNDPGHTPAGDHWLVRSSNLGPGDAVVRDESEYGVLGEVSLIASALRDHGHETQVFAANTAARLTGFLSTERPDAIFNCCESFLGRSALEMSVAGVFDLFEIPYTGSSALTLGLALDKGMAKGMMRMQGINTPSHHIVRNALELAVLSPLAYPQIVKPMCEDASIGIDAAAVVGNAQELAQRVRFVLREFQQPAIVEEFIDGRELNVSLLATSSSAFMTLPISEIRFDGLPRKLPRIVTYEAKWLQQSEYYQATRSECPAVLEERLAQQLRDTAVAAAQALGLRDYGRVDFRIRDGDDAVFVLEVNPNPDLNDDAGFLRAARASGRSYESTVCEILDRCLERSQHAPTTSSRETVT